MTHTRCRYCGEPLPAASLSRMCVFCRHAWTGGATVAWIVGFVLTLAGKLLGVL